MWYMSHKWQVPKYCLPKNACQKHHPSEAAIFPGMSRNFSAAASWPHFLRTTANLSCWQNGKSAKRSSKILPNQRGNKKAFFETKHNQPQEKNIWFYDVLFMAWLFTVFVCCAIHMVTTMVTCSLSHPGFVRSIVACCRMAAESPNLAEHGSWTPCCFLFFSGDWEIVENLNLN